MQSLILLNPSFWSLLPRKLLLQADIALRLAIKDKREGFKMEFETLRELGDLDGAKQVLEKVRALNRAEAMVSSISISTEFDAPPSATEESGEMESSGD
jgi:hypothetical protein